MERVWNRFWKRIRMIAGNRLFVLLVGSGLLLAFMGVMNGGLHIFVRCLDLPTLLYMLLPQLLFFYVTGMWKAFVNGFRIAFSRKEGISRMELQLAVKAINFSGKIAMITAVVLAMMGGISVLYMMSDLSKLGPVLAVVCLSFLYAAILMMILTPVQMKLESKVVSYMEEPEEGEERVGEDADMTMFFKLRAIGLTDREAEVARLVSCGMSNKEIARILYISDTTVKKHVTHILEKTKCGDREVLTEKIKGL